MDATHYINEWLDLIDVENKILKKAEVKLQKMVGSSFENYDVLLIEVNKTISKIIETFDTPISSYGTQVYYDIDLDYSNSKFKGFTFKNLFFE